MGAPNGQSNSKQDGKCSWLAQEELERLEKEKGKFTAGFVPAGCESRSLWIFICVRAFVFFISAFSTNHRHRCEGHNPATTSTRCPMSVLSKNPKVLPRGIDVRIMQAQAIEITCKGKKMNGTGRYTR